MKKITRMLLLTFCILFLSAGQVMAEEPTTFSGTGKAENGKITISVAVDKGGASSGQFELSYDPKLVELVNVTLGSNLENEVVSVNKNYKNNSAILAGFADADEGIKAGQLLEAEFKVTEKIPEEGISFEVSVAEWNGVKQDGTEFEILVKAESTGNGGAEIPETPTTPTTPENTENNGDSTVDHTSGQQDKNSVEEVVTSAEGKKVRKLTSKRDAKVFLSGEDNILPAGADFVLTQISESSASYQNAAAAVAAYVPNCQNFAVYDISLLDSSNVLIHQLNGYVSVTMPVPGGISTASGNKLSVYRLEADGTLTKCESVVNNGMVTFYTNHFSTYIFAEEAAGATPDTSDAGTVMIMVTLLLFAAGVYLVQFGRKRYH